MSEAPRENLSRRQYVHDVTGALEHELDLRDLLQCMTSFIQQMPGKCYA